MNLSKPLNQPQLKNWFNEKFRDEFMIISPYDKQAHAQILVLIDGNGGGEANALSPSITAQLDKIQAVVENNHKYDPIDTDTLREELKFYMADKDLTIHDVARLIEKDSKTVWQFLKGIVKSQDRTIYKIKKLVE